MELQKFIEQFADLFDDTDPSEITAQTHFHDLDEWGSFLGMSVIALAKAQYGKTITGKELRECVTVEDVFNLLAGK